MDISVIIPTRDGNATLGRCLASLKKSTFRPREVIVDGEFLVRDGVLVREDLTRLREEARVQREKLWARADLGA